jgi:hypothetical protein
MMPELKAKELVDKYWIYLRANLLYDDEAKEDAKNCAIIAVDELFLATDDFDLDTKEYWQEVKQEIQKL